MRAISVMLFMTLTSSGDETAKKELPSEWHGHWKGKLKLPDPEGKMAETPMSLAIEPIKDTKKLTWTITYGEGAKSSVRNYELVPGDQPGRFVIDEKNSIVIDATLDGNVLYSQFEVTGALVTARYELRDKVIHVEITSSDKVKETGGTGRVPKVKVFPVKIVQKAALQK